MICSDRIWQQLERKDFLEVAKMKGELRGFARNVKGSVSTPTAWAGLQWVDKRIRSKDPGLSKSETWMVAKVLQIAVILFHYILLYFILSLEETFQEQRSITLEMTIEITETAHKLQRTEKWDGFSRQAGWE